jgi:hypothetical protein
VSDLAYPAPAAAGSEGIVVTGLDPVVRAALESEARRRGISLNDVVLGALSRHAGLAGTTDLFRQFDRLAALPQAEAEEFMAAMGLLDETDLYSDGV